MSSLKERGRQGARPSPLCKGMATVFFLGVLLITSAVSCMVLDGNRSRLEAMIHLQQAAAYQMDEMEVVGYIKCALEHGEVMEGNDFVGEMAVHITSGENMIYVELFGEHPEQLEIRLDAQDRRIEEIIKNDRIQQ